MDPEGVRWPMLLAHPVKPTQHHGEPGGNKGSHRAVGGAGSSKAAALLQVLSA